MVTAHDGLRWHEVRILLDVREAVDDDGDVAVNRHFPVDDVDSSCPIRQDERAEEPGKNTRYCQVADSQDRSSSRVDSEYVDELVERANDLLSVRGRERRGLRACASSSSPTNRSASRVPAAVRWMTTERTSSGLRRRRMFPASWSRSSSGCSRVTRLKPLEAAGIEPLSTGSEAAEKGRRKPQDNLPGFVGARSASLDTTLPIQIEAMEMESANLVEGRSRHHLTRVMFARPFGSKSGRDLTCPPRALRTSPRRTKRSQSGHLLVKQP